MKIKKASLLVSSEEILMKQVISKLLMVILVLGLSGCGGQPYDGGIKASSETDSSKSPSSNNVSIDLNDYESLTKEYLVPLGLSSITATTWSNADKILPDSFGLFYVAKKSSADSPNSINWDTTPFDAEKVESLVKNYFDISSEYLRSSDYYDADSSSYTFESLGGAASFKVVDAKLNNQKLLLSYEYYSPADDVTVIREGVLTITLGEHSYKYVSCVTD